MPNSESDRPTLTGQAEDYLKAIYELEQRAGSAGTNDIAARLGIAPASVTGMIQRLSRLGVPDADRTRPELAASGTVATPSSHRWTRRRMFWSRRGRTRRAIRFWRSIAA